MMGMEMMLKSLGLGEAIEAAQKLVASGALDKILVFANNLDKYTALMEKIGNDYDNTCAKCGGPVSSPDAGLLVPSNGTATVAPVQN